MSERELKTPWHLWVVGIFLLLWQGLASIDFVATITRFEPYLSGFSQEILDYYFNAPIWMYAMWGVAAFGGLLGAILFLMRNAKAVPAFALAWLASLATLFWSLANPAPKGGGDASFMMIVIAGSFLLLLYIAWMQRRGVLR